MDRVSLIATIGPEFRLLRRDSMMHAMSMAGGALLSKLYNAETSQES